MTPEDFSRGLMDHVIDQGMESYRTMYINGRAEESRVPWGKRALTLFHSLKPEQQEVLFEIMQQVSVDTVASVLAVLDGSSPLEGAFEDYELTYDGGEKLNGDLLSLFLAEDEDRVR
jgi:hypothetical protein